MVHITAVTETQLQMTVMYLDDINLLLSLIAAALTSNFNLYLQSECQLLNLIHAFDRIHYARYNTYYHVLLSEHKRGYTNVYKELKNGGFTDSQKGWDFNAVHGDYIYEIQNGETKSTGGPFKSGFSGCTSTFNTWMRTRHIGAKMQSKLKKVLNIKTSSIHRESTPSGIRRHADNVSELKLTACETYQFQFFSGPPRAISTGKEIDASVISGLLSNAEHGNQAFMEFTKERLITGKSSLFHNITKLNIGLTKPPIKSKPAQVLQEDVQGFGILAEQKTTFEDVFQYPVTTLPLSISEGVTKLRTGSKSKFRNDLLDTICFKTKDVPDTAVWIYDTSKVIRCQPPVRTYHQIFDVLIEKMTPPQDAKPIAVHIILDKYLRKDSTKSCTRNIHKEMESNHLFITGLGQTKPSTTTQWQLAVENSETKRTLMSLFANYIRSVDDDMWMVDPLTKQYELLFTYNHEEADTRMNNVVLCANDSDVFFLGLYGCALNNSIHWLD